MSAPTSALAPTTAGSATPGLRKAFRRNALPRDPDPGEPYPKRLVKRPLFWVTLVMLGVYATLLVLLYQQTVPDQEVPGGTLPGLGTEAVPIAARYAAVTAIPLSLLFLWADRFRPQRFWVWLMTFGWGACVATFVSAQVNTWAASQLSIIVLAGLSGAAFAFTENILYYGRVYRYAARTFGEVPPLEALQDLFVLRGVMTFFGHPLFTAMIGIGLAVAVRSKSKVVRVVAPLAGYCAAVFLHMAFNTSASMVSGPALLFLYIGVAIPLVIGMIVFIVRQLLKEGRLIRERLTDYVRVGWLAESDPIALSRLRTRLRALWHAVFLGPDAFLATIRLQRAVTELAYLRDAMTRGIVDQTGVAREKTLLARIREVRPQAVVSPVGLCPDPSFRRQPAALPAYAPPSFPGPAGLGGNYPAPSAFPAPTNAPVGAPSAGLAPLGQTATQYSEVDPNWKPPGE